MPVCTEDLDKAKAEVTGTFHSVEEISAELRESIVNYIKGETYWRFCRPARWKITAVDSSYYLGDGVGRQHTTFTLCQNAARSNEFFLH